MKVLALVSTLLYSVTVAAAEPPTSAERILINGEVITMDKHDTIVEAIAIEGNRIVAVGSNDDMQRLRGPGTEVIDLAGRTVIPGLIDTHIHAIRGGQSFTFETYWYENVSTSLLQGLQQLQDTAAERGPGKWVAVLGSWSPEQFMEKRAPTSAELTAALPDNPAYVQYLYDYAILNAKGLATLGLSDYSRVPEGIRVETDAQGRPTGKIYGGIGPFSVLSERILAENKPDRKGSLQAFFTGLNSLGVTAVIDPSAGGAASYDPLFSLWEEKKLTVRVGYRVPAQIPGNEAAWFRNTLAFLPPRFGDDMLRFLGLGENLVFGMNDGVLMGPGFNPSQAARDELVKVASFAAARRYPLEIHSYTDDAANAILDVFEQVSKQYELKELRWSLAHLNTGRHPTFDRMKKLGIVYTVQMGPYFEAPAIRVANSAATAEVAPPTRDALNAGLMVAGGTDATRIGIPGAWRAIEYNVTGRAIGNTVQRRSDYLLSRLEALRLYTVNAAWLSFDEANRGSLEAGKLADLAILDTHYLTVPADQIHNIRSVLTMVGGKIVYAMDDFMSMVKQ